MNLITAIILVIIFILAYFIIIESFTLAFRTTGLTMEKSRFQAISLFTNCGFTTGESELISQDHRRRRLATALMIIGHVFSVIIVSFVVSLVGNLDVNQVKENYIPVFIIFGSFLFIILFFKLPFISKPLNNSLEKVATRRAMKHSKTNLLTTLDQQGKKSLVEIHLYWVPQILNDKSLKDANITRLYGLNLISIKRKDKSLDVTADTILQPNDKIVIFGPKDKINEIFKEKNKTEIEKINYTGNRISIIDNYGKSAMCEIKIKNLPTSLKNTPLMRSEIKSLYNIQVLMLLRNNENINVNKDTIIIDNDTIIVFGPYDNIKNAFNISETD